MKKLPLIYLLQESLSAHRASSDKELYPTGDPISSLLMLIALPSQSHIHHPTALQRKPTVPEQKSRLARRGAI
jgi:hypothetical protein